MGGEALTVCVCVWGGVAVWDFSTYLNWFLMYMIWDIGILIWTLKKVPEPAAIHCHDHLFLPLLSSII